MASPSREKGTNDEQVTTTSTPMKETHFAFKYPMLTRTNYADSLIMRVNMQAQGLWDVIEHGVADYRNDRMAMSVILRVVPPDMLRTLAVKDTAKEAWDAAKMMQKGVERVIPPGFHTSGELPGIKETKSYVK